MHAGRAARDEHHFLLWKGNTLTCAFNLVTFSIAFSLVYSREGGIQVSPHARELVLAATVEKQKQSYNVWLCITTNVSRKGRIQEKIRKIENDSI